jgi:hypothetical protein
VRNTHRTVAEWAGAVLLHADMHVFPAVKTGHTHTNTHTKNVVYIVVFVYVLRTWLGLF